MVVDRERIETSEKMDECRTVDVDDERETLEEEASLESRDHCAPAERIGDETGV